MKQSKSRLALTQFDIDQFRDELGYGDTRVELARAFLTMTSGAEKADLKPETLREFGKRLENPDDLMKGPGVLVWQNLMRCRGALKR